MADGATAEPIVKLPVSWLVPAKKPKPSPAIGSKAPLKVMGLAPGEGTKLPLTTPVLVFRLTVSLLVLGACTVKVFFCALNATVALTATLPTSPSLNESVRLVEPNILVPTFGAT